MLDTDQKNIEIARRMYETLVGGDMDGALALMSDDIQWIYYGDATTIPFSGVYTGHDGVIQFFADYGEVAEPLGMDLDHFYPSGDTVLVTGSEKSKVKSTDKTYIAPFVHVLKIVKGRVVSYEEYINSAEVANAFR